MTWPETVAIIAILGFFAFFLWMLRGTDRSMSDASKILNGLREATWKVERKPTRDTKEGGGDGA